eukprot:superscaffoldBa00003504_g17082
MPVEIFGGRKVSTTQLVLSVWVCVCKCGASEVSCCSGTRGQQRSARSSRARIYILMYQFPAAAEAVMDDALPALRRCYELLW